MTAPSLNGHAVGAGATPQPTEDYGQPQQQQQQERKPAPSYSRHYEYDYNGHRIPRSNNNADYEGQPQPLRGNLKPSTSLSLLPLARDANDLSFNNKYNRPGSDWNLTTTKRAFRYVPTLPI